MSNTVTLYNCSEQVIPLQVQTPNGDFYLGQQQIRLAPGKQVDLPASHVLDHQIVNLQARGMIKVLNKS